VKLLFKSVIAACKSAAPNELIKSAAVGVADGKGDEVAEDFDAIGELRGADGASDCANRFAARIDTVKCASKNRDISVIF